MNIVHLDSSARRASSVGRRLTQRLVQRLSNGRDDVRVTRRDLDERIPLLSEALLSAVSLPPEERDLEQTRLASTADALIEELESADAVVLGVPIYNFGVPASFKAWIDLVARAGRTFRYTPQGPVGLLKDRPVYVVVTSGGTRLGSDIDFVTPWLRHVLGFVGLHDVRIVDATGLMTRGESQVARAEAVIDATRPSGADRTSPAGASDRRVA